MLPQNKKISLIVLPEETPLIIRQLAGSIVGLLKHFTGPQSLAGLSDLDSTCYMGEVYEAIESLKEINNIKFIH